VGRLTGNATEPCAATKTGVQRCKNVNQTELVPLTAFGSEHAEALSAQTVGQQSNNIKVGCFLTPLAPNQDRLALGWKGAAGVLGLAVCA
jgi:hypothetical protein